MNSRIVAMTIGTPNPRRTFGGTSTPQCYATFRPNTVRRNGNKGSGADQLKETFNGKEDSNEKTFDRVRALS